MLIIELPIIDDAGDAAGNFDIAIYEDSEIFSIGQDAPDGIFAVMVAFAGFAVAFISVVTTEVDRQIEAVVVG